MLEVDSVSPEKSKEQVLKRLGEINNNCQNELMQIINYRKATDIDIRFLQTNNVIYHQSYSNFKKGALKDYYLPTLYDVGIIGNSRIYNINGEKTLSFRHWEYMLKRCYYQRDLQRYPTYAPCEVCNDWLNLSNFERWVENNYYQCGNEKMCLDKDILFKIEETVGPNGEKRGEKVIWFVHPFPIGNIDYKLKTGQISYEDIKPYMAEDEIWSENIEKDDLILLRDALNKLNDSEKELIIKRYFYNMTQSEIAKQNGINQVKVSREEGKVLTKLRSYM